LNIIITENTLRLHYKESLFNRITGFVDFVHRPMF
jgi:hypothetical protein